MMEQGLFLNDGCGVVKSTSCLTRELSTLACHINAHNVQQITEIIPNITIAVLCL